MQLGDLPPELHILIASYVCQIDIPASSCANELEDKFPRPPILSLEQVSRYWSAIAQPYKYRVLKVSVVPANTEGAESAVTKLLRRLASLPAHKRRTRDLHLSGPSHPTLEPSEIDYTQTLPQLISLLSPTLHSLTLSFPSSGYSTSLIACTYSVPFPRLTHLRITGFYPPPRVSAPLPLADPQAQDAAAQRETSSNFPALAHLRLSGVRNPSGILPSSALRRAFPALRTLEIAGVSGAPHFAHDVALAVAAHDGVLSSPDAPGPGGLPGPHEAHWHLSDTRQHSDFPATLTRLLISTLPPPNAIPQGPNMLPSHSLGQRHSKMIGVLKALEHRPRPRDGQRPRLEVNVVEDTVQCVS